MVPRTLIVPLRLEHADALLEGEDAFTARYGWHVAAGYLDEPDVLPLVRSALAAGTPPEWYSHLVVDPDAATVVGFGGYKGPPADGIVEIGYSIAPDHQRRGHATAAVDQLLRFARERGIEQVRAHTLPRESASTRLLARAGFRVIEVVTDEELGEVWRWTLCLAPHA